MRIAVAGGTGVVGRHVVQAALDAGHEAVVISRRTGVDARTGMGLSGALEGVDVIVDAANQVSTGRAKATTFFEEVTGNLQSVGAAQGVSRLVTLSIVGIDRVPGFGYYQAKLAHEAAAGKGPLPVSIVRATQFHEFPAQVLARLHLGPLGAMPVMRVQPVSARAVGQFLVQVATSPADGTTVEIAGPQEEDLIDLARAILLRRGARGMVVPIRLPGGVGKAMRSGALLPGAGAHIEGPSFKDWLEEGGLDSMTG
jgi:uncharacterized protein YbjT (DUF2867 family)